MVARIIRNNRKPENYGEVKAMVEELLPEAKEEHYNINKISKAISAGTASQQEVVSFEQEQEEKAVISYEELLKNAEVRQMTTEDVVAVELPASPKIEHIDLPKETPIKPVMVKSSNMEQTRNYLQELKSFQKKLRQKFISIKKYKHE